MRTYEIPVTFTGTVTVTLPDDKPSNADDAKLLAKQLALSHVIATCDNPDAPDDVAFEDYLHACSAADDVKAAAAAWDAGVTGNVSGTWSLTN